MDLKQRILYSLDEAARLLGLDIPILRSLLRSTGISTNFPARSAIGDSTLRILYRKLYA